MSPAQGTYSHSHLIAQPELDRLGVKSKDDYTSGALAKEFEEDGLGDIHSFLSGFDEMLEEDKKKRKEKVGGHSTASRPALATHKTQHTFIYSWSCTTPNI